MEALIQAPNPDRVAKVIDRMTRQEEAKIHKEDADTHPQAKEPTPPIPGKENSQINREGMYGSSNQPVAKPTYPEAWECKVCRTMHAMWRASRTHCYNCGTLKGKRIREDQEANESNKKTERMPVDNKRTRDEETTISNKACKSDGESRGEMSEKMDIDRISDSEFEEMKQSQRSHKMPFIEIKSPNSHRSWQMCKIQASNGAFFIYECPKNS